MTDENEKIGPKSLPPSPPMGAGTLTLQVGPDGSIQHEIMGQFDEAQLLGFGVYLTNLANAQSHKGLHVGQLATLDLIQKIAQILDEKVVITEKTEETEEKEEECSKELSSES